MATATILVIFTFLFIIILTEKISLRIISRGHLTVEVSSVLFKLTLTDFKSKKRKKSGPPASALRSAMIFFLRHSDITVYDVSVYEGLPLSLRYAATAFFSLIFAYCDSISGKINLPKETGDTHLPFTFDICTESRLCIFISAFVILKIKCFLKHGARARNVG